MTKQRSEHMTRDARRGLANRVESGLDNIVDMYEDMIASYAASHGQQTESLDPAKRKKIRESVVEAMRATA